MKTLLRLSAAVILVAAVTACGEMPTAASADAAPVRRDAGTMGGGFRSGDTDTTTINTINGDPTVSSTTSCLEARGGVTMGGGFFVEPPTCQ